MYCIIYNPTAGAGRSAKAMQIVKQLLDQKNVPYHVFETQYQYHSIELARNAIGKGYNGIISVGGDGTLLEVAGVLHGTDEVLGIIPAGTGNDFRKAIDVPREPADALEVILSGHKRKVDMGLFGDDQYFLNVAGTGFDVEVLRNTEKVRRMFTGGMAYFLGILLSIFGYRSVTLDITANGQTFRRNTMLIAIANGKCYGGGLSVAPEADVEDGLFNVIILNRVPNWRILFELPKMKKGHVEKIPGFESFVCRDIYIDSPKPLKFNLDGDVYGETPVRLSLIPKSLNVFCP